VNRSVSDSNDLHESDWAMGADDPGPLRGQVWLTLQTVQARRLVRGRSGSAGKPPIFGLTTFADRLRVIWQAARDDDPYADWWLIKIHEALESKEKRLRSIRQMVDERLAQMDAIEVAVATSERPFRTPLRFANPYAYRAAHLLANYDAEVCAALTAHHVGVLAHRTCVDLIRQGSHEIRGLFSLPQGYRFLRIDRGEVERGSPKARDAERRMGSLPDEVLSGEHRAPLAPQRRRRSSGFSDHMQLHPASPSSEGRFCPAENDDA